MAVGLAEAGADIVAMDRSGGGDETRAQVEALGRRFYSVKADLINAPVEQLKENITQVINDAGKLDILVNNAGIIRRSTLLDYTEQDWDDVMNVNLKVLFFLSQAAAEHMKDNGGGKIIHIASLLSYQGGILVAAYTAAKHAVAGLTRIQANEWAPLGINVNAIAPGYMATDNTAPLQNDVARNKAIVDRIPVGHWGTPDDLKGAVVFLASDASRYMHGSLVPVDGGWLGR